MEYRLGGSKQRLRTRIINLSGTIRLTASSINEWWQISNLERHVQGGGIATSFSLIHMSCGQDMM